MDKTPNNPNTPRNADPRAAETVNPNTRAGDQRAAEQRSNDQHAAVKHNQEHPIARRTGAEAAEIDARNLAASEEWRNNQPGVGNINNRGIPATDDQTQLTPHGDSFTNVSPSDSVEAPMKFDEPENLQVEEQRRAEPGRVNAQGQPVVGADTERAPKPGSQTQGASRR